MEIKFNVDAETFAIALGKRSDDETRHVTIEFAKLHPNALEAIFLYGMQRKFNDATGGADKTLDKKVEIASSMRDNFYAGIVKKVRTAKAGEPAVNRFIRQILRANMGDATKAEYKALASEDRDDFLMDKFDGLTEEQKAAVTKQAQKLLDLENQKQKDLADVTI